MDPSGSSRGVARSESEEVSGLKGKGYTFCFISSFQQSALQSGRVPILQMEEWRLRETEPHPQGHIANKWQNWGLNPYLADSKASELSIKPGYLSNSFPAAPAPLLNTLNPHSTSLEEGIWA